MSAASKMLEVHLLHALGPGNLNRGAEGDPKTCVFGGRAVRARISSQCQKAAWRSHPLFVELCGEPLAQRSRRHIRQLREPLIAAGKDPAEVQRVLEAFLTRFLSKMHDNKDPDMTATQLYLGPAEIQAMVAELQAHWTDLVGEVETEGPATKGVMRALVKQFTSLPAAPDLALFGRMAASRPELSLEGAVCVAHAISTHAVAVEYDFFTSQDHLAAADEAGAAMMDYAGFVAACYYRYFSVDLDTLRANLQGEVELIRRTLTALLHTALIALPTGKQTGFATFQPPDLVLGVVRADRQRWNLSNAFEAPVREQQGSGLVIPSVERLDTYFAQVNATYGREDSPVRTFVLAPRGEALPLKNLRPGLVTSADTWVSEVVQELMK